MESPACKHCGVEWEELQEWEKGLPEEQEMLRDHKAEACGCAQCRLAVTKSDELAEPNWKALGLNPPNEPKEDPKEDLDWDDPGLLELG